MAVIDLKEVTIKIKDGTTPTPKELEVKLGEGNMTYTINRQYDYILDKGLLDAVREGDQVPMDVSFNATYEYYTGVAPTPTIAEALEGVGVAASEGWISSDTVDPCNPYAVDIEIVNAPNCTAANSTETLTIPHFRVETITGDLDAGQFSFAGRANVVRPSAVRSTPP